MRSHYQNGEIVDISSEDGLVQVTIRQPHGVHGHVTARVVLTTLEARELGRMLGCAADHALIQQRFGGER
ncbi:MAG: hypothetical protein AAFV53_00430 [Myxococcota bacterium]